VIEKFKKNDYNCLVATSIGEEGLDIGEVDFIVIYNCPKTSIKAVSVIMSLLTFYHPADRFNVAISCNESEELGESETVTSMFSLLTAERTRTGTLPSSTIETSSPRSSSVRTSSSTTTRPLCSRRCQLRSCRR